jgi:hypothetical protein
VHSAVKQIPFVATRDQPPDSIELPSAAHVVWASSRIFMATFLSKWDDKLIALILPEVCGKAR